MKWSAGWLFIARLRLAFRQLCAGREWVQRGEATQFLQIPGHAITTNPSTLFKQHQTTTHCSLFFLKLRIEKLMKLGIYFDHMTWLRDSRHGYPDGKTLRIFLFRRRFVTQINLVFFEVGIQFSVCVEAIECTLSICSDIADNF